MTAMRRRWRVLKWAGTVSALSMPGLLYLSWDHDIYVQTRWGYGIHVVEGDLALSWWHKDRPRGPGRPVLSWGARFRYRPWCIGWGWVFQWPRYSAPKHEVAPGIRVGAHYLDYRDYYHDGMVGVPMLAVFALIAVPTAWLWWRDRRRIPPGHCQKCGYNLTGNVSGRCPECGTAIEAHPTRDAPS